MTIEELKQKLKEDAKKKLREKSSQRKTRFDLRKKAQRAMKDLPKILGKLQQYKKSENDYAQIFRDDKLYFDMLQACDLAYSESYKSKIKLYQNPEELFKAIQVYSIKIGMKVNSKKELANRSFQNRFLEELEKHPNCHRGFLEYYKQLISKEKKIEELLKKELHLRAANSTIIDLYTENRKKENAFYVASRVYGKILEEDQIFMKKTLEQILHEFLTENGLS